MPSGTQVSTGQAITAAKMNTKLETIDNDDLVHAVALEDEWTAGVDGAGQDVTWYSDTEGRAIRYDASAYRVTYDDNMILAFGTGYDVAIKWTSANLTIMPVADDTGAIIIGDGSKDIDLKIYLGSVNEYVEFNVGDSKTNFVGNASMVISITSTLTGATADNAVEITVTDNQTNAANYARALYIAYTAAGTKSASGEANALGIDLTVTGNTPYAYIGSFYMNTSGNPTIGLASALSIYMDNMGTNLGSQHILDLQTGNPTASAATTRETYIRFRNHGTGTPTSMFYAQANNNAKAATYFLEQDPVAVGPAQVGAFTNDTIGTDAEDGFINCHINGQVVKIPFWYDD